MNVIAESTSVSVIKVSFATVVVLKLLRRKYVVSAWDTSNWWCLLFISGISVLCQIRSVTCWVLPSKKLEQIIYYERYVVIQPGIKEEDGINRLDFLTEEEYLDIVDKLPRDNQLLDDNDPNKFIAKMGAEAFEMLLSRIESGSIVL